VEDAWPRIAALATAAPPRTFSPSGRISSSTLFFNTMMRSERPLAAMSVRARSATLLASTAYTLRAPALMAKYARMPDPVPCASERAA